ncbi:hypothetical protein C1645_779971 [Glomus cerebriforme]|uniref:J domain-containing protein n=1 Tax=Glomus cerebriforme TaxID=658196 RepID=A0A397SKU4_9GLOM|nr:hypothetical protein C1645_779971 [Glomus cerebriforme]
MDLQAKLRENKRQLESGEINEDKYHECRKSILDKWSGETDAINKPKRTDLYVLLQLEPNATGAKINSSYRRLALKYHPDKNGGIEPEEWSKLSNAYQILSDKNSRILYDNFGTINNSLAGRASLNHYVGGDSWQPYIGDLETGPWLFSFMEHNNINRTEQKEHRHTIRVSNIVRFLQDKLSRFPKQDNPSELKSFEGILHQEAQKLSAESNGKELLSLLGKIYISEAQAYLSNIISIDTFDAQSYSIGNFFKSIMLFTYLIFGYLTLRTKDRPNQEEIYKVVWKLSRSEISSIARETCKEIFNNKNRNKESNHLANSLHLLGKVWLEVSTL